MSIQDAFAAIEKQIKNTPKHQVYVIEIESIPFRHITKDLQTYMESFSSLQYLAINNCGLDSLENFPKLPSLIRLDLISNNLVDGFSNLKNSKYIQTLFLSANQISYYNSLDSLSFLGNLLQLDLIANPITLKSDYSDEIFKKFPSLKFLDSKDRNGQISNESQNMTESLERIRPGLFVRGQSLQTLDENHEEENKENKEKQPAEETESRKTDKKPVKPIRRTNTYRKKIMDESKKTRSLSAKYGLIFPIGRIRKQLREKVDIPKLSMGATVYLAAVLEYMSAEILEVSGNKAKELGFKRIMPKHLLQGIKFDLELKEFYESAIIPETEFISKLRID